eukprot:1205815-Karenia_brevis.AAC.1
MSGDIGAARRMSAQSKPKLYMGSRPASSGVPYMSFLWCSFCGRRPALLTVYGSSFCSRSRKKSSSSRWKSPLRNPGWWPASMRSSAAASRG